MPLEMLPYRPAFLITLCLDFFKFIGYGSRPRSIGYIAQPSCVSESTILGLRALHLTIMTGDMVIGGPSYSPLLLTVLCAHSARFDSRETSEMLVSRARLLLGAEIHRPSSISTAQALLQLSARDLAYGSISQAWLYSGMAFRMVSDLGLHHSTARIATLGCLGAEDLEIRRRLFWSCYLWDKAISLYLGRTPVMPDLPSNRSLELSKWLLLPSRMTLRLTLSQWTTRPRMTCGRHIAASGSI
jgi:hypothetical protein